MLKTIVKGLLSLLLVVAVVGGGLGLFVWKEMQQPLAIPEEGMLYEVKEGASIRSVARDLKQKALLPNRWYFELWARWVEPGSAIKTGEYFLASGSTIADILKEFRHGVPVQHKLTIVEGSRFTDVVSQLEKVIDAGLMKRIIKPGEYAKVFVEMTGEKAPEGWIFPDTYHFPKGQTDKGFLKQAYRRMKETLERAWAARAADLPLKTPYEALILASIIEKETGAAAERPMIGGVFINRLKKKMKLQTDPTVIYGMGDRYKGNIRKKDLRSDNPFNTYTRKGLPPTPIAMPGEEAIMAAVKPADTEALFFVARGKGRHYFSATYKEHKQAVIKYLLGGNAKRYRGDD